MLILLRFLSEAISKHSAGSNKPGVKEKTFDSASCSTNLFLKSFKLLQKAKPSSNSKLGIHQVFWILIHLTAL